MKYMLAGITAYIAGLTFVIIKDGHDAFVWGALYAFAILMMAFAVVTQ